VSGRRGRPLTDRTTVASSGNGPAGWIADHTIEQSELARVEGDCDYHTVG
jgi:hypothetical protein